MILATGVALGGAEPQNYISLWKFEGNANDEAGINDGQLVAGASTVYDSDRQSNVLKLNGSGQYVTIPNNSSIQGKPNGDMSFSVWFKGNDVTSTSFGKALISKSVGGPLKEYMVMPYKGQMFFTFEANGESYGPEISNGSLSNGQWYHAAVTWNNATGTAEMYLNGVKISSDTTGYDMPVTDTDLYIGRKGYPTDQYFNGLIDDVVIYDRVLSQQEIIDMFGDPSYKPPIRIMPLGDSITNGTTYPGLPDQSKMGYRQPLDELLNSAGYNFDFVGSLQSGNYSGNPSFDYDHEGHGGWEADGGTGGGIESNIFNWLQAKPAEVILLHIGTNDIKLDQDPNTVALEVEGILDEIDRYSEDITVILARIILRMDGKNPQTIAFNDAVDSIVQDRIVAGDDIVVVDMENALDYSSDMADPLHPNTAGYEKMALVWFDALKGILPPVETSVRNVVLQASSPDAKTADDLTCSFDLLGEATTSAAAWHVNDQPQMLVYLPMEGGNTNALEDYSGSGNHATADTASLWQQGTGYDGGGAFWFDTTDDTELDLGNVMPVNGSFTKTVNFYRVGGLRDSYHILSDDVGSDLLWTEDKGDGFKVHALMNDTYGTVSSPIEVAENQWYFTAVTYDHDATAGSGVLTLHIYDDSGNIWTDSKADVAPLDSTGQLYVGGQNGTSNFKGYIDDVRIYGHALSEDQLDEVYAGTLTITASETNEDDVWFCDVTPFSLTEAGSTVRSNTVTISSSDPPDVPIGDVIIIDNGDAGTSRTGYWPFSSGANYYGTKSQYSRNGTTYTFSTAVTGDIEIAMWWTEGSTRASQAPVRIYDGSLLLDTVHVNQRDDGGKWNVLGTYSFSSGSADIMVLANGGSSTCVDAMRYTVIGEIDPNSVEPPDPGGEDPPDPNSIGEIIIDNGDTGTSAMGYWPQSSGKNYYGSKSVYGRYGATYTFTASANGTANVYAWWTEYSTRSTSVPIQIYDGNQLLDTVYVNQRTDGGKWMPLGTYSFTGTGKVVIMAQGSASTCADGVKFEF